MASVVNGRLHLVRAANSLPSAPSTERHSIRRVYDNRQIIERFDQWLLLCKKAANTQSSYTTAAKQFAKFIVDKPLTAATKEDVRDFIGALFAEGKAATTIQARLDALRALGDCLQLGGLVRASVPRFILRRKLPKRLPHAKSEEEIEQLIASARTPRDLAILELGYASGLRVSELANLLIEDVTLRARSLIVRQGKGGNDRIALFGRAAAAALHEYIGDRTSGRLFLQHPLHQRGGVSRGRYGVWRGQWREDGKLRSVRLGDYDIPNRERARLALDAYLADKLPEKGPDTKPLGRKGVYRAIVAAAKRAGLTGVTPHTLRHSCATHCMNHGMDIRFIQELLGHASPSTTTKYLHTATERLKSVHTKFFPGEADHE
jgi:site-specific recombinase XerD